MVLASLQDEFPFTWCPSENSDTSISSMANRKPLPLSCIWAILWRNSRYRPKQTLLQKWTKCKRKHVHPEITPLRGGCFGFWRILPMWTWKIWNCTWISKTKKTLSSSKELWKYMEITPLDISSHHCSNPIFQLPQHVICKFGQQKNIFINLSDHFLGGSCFGSKPFQTTCYSVCGILGLKTIQLTGPGPVPVQPPFHDDACSPWFVTNEDNLEYIHPCNIHIFTKTLYTQII